MTHAEKIRARGLELFDMITDGPIGLTAVETSELRTIITTWGKRVVRKDRAHTKRMLRKPTRRQWKTAFKSYLNGGNGAVIEQWHRRRGIQLTRHDLSQAAGAHP
jgi:hypothetical protein